MPMSINRKVPTASILDPGSGETVSIAGLTLTFKTTGSQSDDKFLVLEFTMPPQDPSKVVAVMAKYDTFQAPVR